MILIRKDIPFTKYDLSTEINALAVQIKLEKIITICSIYLSPNNSINIEQLNELIKKLPKPFLLLGDFNARHLLWHDIKSNSRGNLILDFIIENQLHILDDNKPTHFDQRTKGYSHIDLSLCTQDLADSYFWNTYDDLCGSDHFPVVISILKFTKEITINKFDLNRTNRVEFGECIKNVPLWDNTLGIETILVMLVILVIDEAELTILIIGKVKMKCPVPWWNEE